MKVKIVGCVTDYEVLMFNFVFFIIHISALTSEFFVCVLTILYVCAPSIKFLNCIHKLEWAKNPLLPHTRVKNALPWPEVKAAVKMPHRCRYCIIDNVAFVQENTNETFEAIKH